MNAITSEFKEAPATWGQVFLIWFALFWRRCLGFGVLAVILGMLFSIIIPDSMGEPAKNIIRFSLCTIAGFILDIYIFRMVVGKHFGDFIFSMISNEEAPLSGRAYEISASNFDIVRIWWAYTWRGIIYGFFLSLLAFFVGAISIHRGVPLAAIKPFIKPILVPADIFVCWFVPLKVIIGKKIGGFRLSILTH